MTLMTVVETPAFANEAKRLLSEEERSDLVACLAEKPEAGKIIERTGGVRKLRFARKGEGKRGGDRVIYYYHAESIPLFALMIYPKKPQGFPDYGRKKMPCADMWKKY